AVEAKVVVANAGTDHFRSGVVQMRFRCSNLMRTGARVESSFISTALKFPPEWSRQSWRMWTYIERRCARIDLSPRERRSSARRRFSFRGPARVGGTEMDRKTTNQTHRDPAGELAGHLSPGLCSARNVPTSGERRKHPATPANVEAVIAIRRLRRRQIRPAKRTEIRSEV